MSSRGKVDRWPGFAAPLLALLVTLGLTLLMALLTGRADAEQGVSGLALLMLMPAPMVVAVLWGGALLIGRPHRLAPLAAAVWLAGAWFGAPHDQTIQLVGYVAAGLLAGVGLGLRWRLDAALLTMALVMSPILVWTSLQVPVAEQLDMFRTEMLKGLEQKLPSSANEKQRARVLATEQQKLDQVTALAAKLYPAVLGMGLLGQAGIVLSLLWLALRALGLQPHRWRLPPFPRWRVPFYVVWVLVAGLGLLVTRRPWLATGGLNLVLLAAAVLSVQGLAIQFFVTGRMMSGPGRVIYWLVMGFFFAPLVLASGVVLGLVDQWWDIRRLGDRDDNDEGKSDDEPAEPST